MAPNLLFLGTETEFDEAFRREVVELTRGRLVFSTFASDGHVLDETMLSTEAQKARKYTIGLLWDAYHASINPETTNEWESLYNVRSRANLTVPQSKLG